METAKDRMDELLADALKGGAREMALSDEFMGRLLHETRPYARFRNHPRAWALAAALTFVSLGSFGMWTGVIPVPRFFAASSVGAPAVPVRVADEGPVAVPVQRAAARVVREAKPEIADDIDRSIVNALDYLVSQQREDGTFPAQYGKSTAMPALAGMAFLSKGCLTDDKRYGKTILKCIDYVLSQADMRDNQRFKGYLGGADGGRMYAHSISTLFLSECSGMVDEERQAKIDEVLPFAVRVIVDAQNQQKAPQHLGGWRYDPGAGDSDLSCSGWALMALKSARLNGAPVPDDAIEKAVLYIKRAYRDSDGTFGYQGANGSNADTLSGAAILCLELCGRHLEPEALKAAKYLQKTYRRALAGGGGHPFYGLYYTAQGLFQIGGDIWKEFEPWMYETYRAKQRPDGSWVGGGNESSPIYATAMTVLAFTVPYRMLPIYQRDETVDY